jgi:hypothetical protein
MSESVIQGMRYEIRTVEDFLSVPTEKLPMCLKDFSNWLCATKEFVETAKKIPGAKAVTDTFIWLDDDLNHVILEVHETQDGATVAIHEYHKPIGVPKSE